MTVGHPRRLARRRASSTSGRGSSTMTSRSGHPCGQVVGHDVGGVARSGQQHDPAPGRQVPCHPSVRYSGGVARQSVLEVAAVGDGHGGQLRPHAELAEGRADVGAHRGERDHQLVGDVLGRPSLGQVEEDPPLAGGQPDQRLELGREGDLGSWRTVRRPAGPGPATRGPRAGGRGRTGPAPPGPRSWPLPRPRPRRSPPVPGPGGPVGGGQRGRDAPGPGGPGGRRPRPSLLPGPGPPGPGRSRRWPWPGSPSSGRSPPADRHPSRSATDSRGHGGEPGVVGPLGRRVDDQHGEVGDPVAPCRGHQGLAE